jgi:hypothetical protein
MRAMRSAEAKSRIKYRFKGESCFGGAWRVYPWGQELVGYTLHVLQSHNPGPPGLGPQGCPALSQPPASHPGREEKAWAQAAPLRAA